MKTKSDRRMNRKAKAINKMLKEDKLIEDYRVYQICKHRIDDISYYVYEVVNIKEKTVLGHCWGSESELNRFNKLLFRMNDLINDDMVKDYQKNN